MFVAIGFALKRNLSPKQNTWLYWKSIKLMCVWAAKRVLPWPEDGVWSLTWNPPCELRCGAAAITAVPFSEPKILAGPLASTVLAALMVTVADILRAMRHEKSPPLDLTTRVKRVIKFYHWGHSPMFPSWAFKVTSMTCLKSWLQFLCRLQSMLEWQDLVLMQALQGIADQSL